VCAAVFGAFFKTADGRMLSSMQCSREGRSRQFKAAAWTGRRSEAFLRRRIRLLRRICSSCSRSRRKGAEPGAPHAAGRLREAGGEEPRQIAVRPLLRALRQTMPRCGPRSSPCSASQLAHRARRVGRAPAIVRCFAAADRRARPGQVGASKTPSSCSRAAGEREFAGRSEALDVLVSFGALQASRPAGGARVGTQQERCSRQAPGRSALDGPGTGAGAQVSAGRAATGRRAVTLAGDRFLRAALLRGGLLGVRLASWKRSRSACQAGEGLGGCLAAACGLERSCAPARARSAWRRSCPSSADRPGA